jgi:Transcriptional regulator
VLYDFLTIWLKNLTSIIKIYYFPSHEEAMSQTLPRRRKPNAKDRLLTAGMRLFTDPSKNGLTSRQIAQEAKVNHALIAYHYGNVANLMDAVLNQCLEDLQEQITPHLDAFQRIIEEADRKTLSAAFKEGIQHVVIALRGEKSAALLRALTMPDAKLIDNVYPRFTAAVSKPLFTVFAALAAKAGNCSKDSLEAAVLAQLLVAHAMAFFRGASLVREHLGVESLAEEDQARVTETIIAAMARTVGL